MTARGERHAPGVPREAALELPRVRMRGRDLLRFALGLGVAGTFLYVVLDHVSWADARAAFSGARPGPMLLCLPLLAMDFTVRTVRWWVMLRRFEPTLPLRDCFGPFLGSYAINNVLPMRAGDVVRVVAFTRQLRSPAMRLLGTLLVERLLDLFTLLAILLVGLTLLPEGAFPDWFVRSAVLLTAAALGGLVIATVALNPVRRWFARLGRGRHGDGHGLVPKTARRLDQAVEILSLFRSPRMVGALVGLSLLAWTLEGAVFAAVAWSFRLDAGIVGPWFAAATGTLSTLIPSSPGYVGTFDYFTIRGIMAFGAEREAATIFALLVHLWLWFPVTLAGGLFFLAPRGRRTWRQAHAVSAHPVRKAS